MLATAHSAIAAVDRLKEQGAKRLTFRLHQQTGDDDWLIIMREEWLGHLNTFERIVPTLFDNRLRIERMREQLLWRTVIPGLIDSHIHAIRAEGIRIGADPLGGASVDYWGAIAERQNLDLTVVNPLVDATWRFMTLDTDGKIRMDCSSPNAMASLIANREDRKSVV